MFESIPKSSTFQRHTVAFSFALHALFFAWLLHPPEPRLLNPESVALGHDGKVFERLYFPTQRPDDSETNSSDDATEVYRHQHLGHEKLTWRPQASAVQLRSARTQLAGAGAEDRAETATLSKSGHGAPAGPAYGTLTTGAVSGDEIRPALPVTTADPVAYPWELPASDGRVVVEITIDERGEIIAKTVLESLGSKLDQRVLEALNNWHFQPATHNGVAIASKQDAIFHFHARG